MNKKIIAITGGIGTGKSTILDIFRRLGCDVADADDIAHQLYVDENSPVLPLLDAHWGKAVFNADGSVNRQAIAEKVFGNELELSWLNGIMHPLIQKEILALAEQVAPRPLFCAIPLLYETEWEKMADLVISVWCDVALQHKRLLQRGWSEAEIKARLAVQLDMDEKLKRCDFGIVNNGTLEMAREQCRYILERI